MVEGRFGTDIGRRWPTAARDGPARVDCRRYETGNATMNREPP